MNVNLIRTMCWASLGFLMIGAGIYAIVTGKPGYEAIVDAMPVFRDYYMYTFGMTSILGGVMLFELFWIFDDERDIRELEARIEELEREWSEADLGDDEDEIGYA